MTMGISLYLAFAGCLCAICRLCIRGIQFIDNVFKTKSLQITMSTESQNLEKRVNFTKNRGIIVRQLLNDLVTKINTKNYLSRSDDFGVICIYRQFQAKGLIFEKKYVQYIGKLQIDSLDGKEQYDKNWACQIFGEEFVSPLTKLVEELSQPFNVRVNVTLESNVPNPAGTYKEFLHPSYSSVDY